MQKARLKTQRLVALSVLTALIVILQLLSNSVKVGGVSITLSLIPIVVGAALYGVSAGAFLGGALGVVTLICCITGMDLGGSVLWNANPLMTAIVCLGKATAAGCASGLIYRALEKRNQTVAAVCSGVVCPVVNTSLFCLAMVLFFQSTLLEWAGGQEIVSYILFGLAGINFLVELAVNLVLSPTVIRIINITQRGR